ncbi:MAG: DUF1501 domain-containing protein [Planctomycetes bacterium]|nr:DUF1501 domain-containing protein [Planctomycetota bacterium]
MDCSPTDGTFQADSAHFKRVTRREILRVGFVGTVALSLGDYFGLLGTARADDGTARPAGANVASPAAESVILIFFEGGMSHLDSFDPKPYAPIEIRGDLGVVNANVDGIQLSGLWKRTAGVADKMAFVRSMTHGEAAHERGSHNMLTGYRPSPAIAYPSMGSVVSHEYGPRNDLPAYIAVPNADGGSGFAGTGYLSSAYGAYSISGEPNDDNFVVRDLSLPPGVDETRMERRKGLLVAVDEHFRKLENSARLDAVDSFYQRAYSLISSKSAREAFNIKAEPAEVRNAYGRNTFGQRLLIARRLVEAGARFVTVFYGGWDLHKDVHKGMRDRVPSVDQGTAALIQDLSDRGMLGKTLVTISTEFGRTSRVNKDRGRDHWPKVFSIAFAGGGVPGGQVIGASNASATEVVDNPVTPADVSATIFTKLGIDPTKKLLTAGGRPIDLVRGGSPVAKLM